MNKEKAVEAADEVLAFLAGLTGFARWWRETPGPVQDQIRERVAVMIAAGAVLEVAPNTVLTVAALDGIDATDGERAHKEADALLLAAVAPRVAAAYRRVEDRAPWWAAA